MIYAKKSLFPISVFFLSTALAIGIAYAQPGASTFGKPGEPIHLVVGFQTY